MKFVDTSRDVLSFLQASSRFAMLPDEIAGLKETHISSLLRKSAGLTCPCRSQSHGHEYEERPDSPLLVLMLIVR